MKIEQLLGLSADSQRFGKIHDLLSKQVDSVNEKYFSSSMTLLSDSEMQLVAGGRVNRLGENDPVRMNDFGSKKN